MSEPKLEGVYHLKFIGDWGQANFHRICSWLTQEFCDRAGKGSRTSILSQIDGGKAALREVHNGEADMCLATPALLMSQALTGEGIFEGQAMPRLRSLAVLPQIDRMLFAVSPALGVSSFEDIREKKPPLRIATSGDDGTNFIGYVAERFLAAHGLDEATVESWGGKFLKTVRPEQALALIESGEANAVAQEAIMTPWWSNLIDTDVVRLVPCEGQALHALQAKYGFALKPLKAGHWDSLTEDFPTVDFSDFLLIVRDDMDEDVAHLLAWSINETRDAIERGYRHLPPRRAPLSYPLVPADMAKTSIPLHPGAERYYREAGHL